MKEPKFTPGPWAFGNPDPEICYADTSHAKYEITGIGTDKATYVLASVITDIDELDNDANARLMAAAPDLFEALQALVALSNESCVGPWDKARAAISKALGGQS